MDGFLRKVSDYIFSSYGEKIDDLCVVLPNRRAGLFFKQHLSRHSDKPIWAPELFSIEDFIWELSGLKKADTAEQLYIFYSVYKEAEKEKAETFELFCKWAPTLLNDFNETDAYLADTEKLFGNLSDIRGIEEWSLGNASLTDFQKQYLHFWSSIGGWYRSYREALVKERLAYPGLAYRYVAENITELLTNKKWRKIIFAGFNALNSAEEKIIAGLRESGKADVLWDADRYYIENTANEAGRFLRKYRKEYFKPPVGSTTVFEHIEDRYSTEAKKITVAGVARMVSQAKAASHFLETFEKENRYSTRTAIVLGDESLLLPLLHALPEEAQNINITMGFPLRNTPVASLVNALFQLHLNAERFNVKTAIRDGGRERKFYHADLTRLFRHPYIKQLLSQSGLAEKLATHITAKNIIFSSAGQLENYFPLLKDQFAPIRALLTPWTEIPIALEGLHSLIEMLRPVFSLSAITPGSNLNIELEYLFQLHLIIKRAGTLHQKWNIASDVATLKALIDQQLASSTLPFVGEPLSGLQIMGVLETRTLDFENVILLSANENILPAGKAQHSFILYDLRKYFNMPVWDDKDAVAAYHFYRLFQRAKNIVIVHNTDQELFGNREKSRFVTQLLYELPAANKNIRIEEVVFDAGLPATDIAPELIIIPKTGSVPAKMDELSAQGLSPSLLNTYRNCSLQFYFHYVAHLREPDEVKETIGADTLGTIIHKSLDEIYRPQLGQLLSADFFDTAKKKVPHSVEAAFAQFYSAEESSYGKNLLAKKIAVRYLLDYFSREKKNLETNLSGVPHVSELETTLEFTVEINGKKIKLKGQADRIDKTDYLVTLIDYKTGKTEQKELKVKEWPDISTNTAIGKSFQLLMYAWLYSRMKGNTLPVSSGIVSFRKLSDGFMNVSTPDGDFILPQTLDYFEKALIELLSGLFDSSKAFVQTDDLDICKLCDFKGICRR
ncbi:MAG: PD-(D/E)XK nuclease family protein [Bacteroidota bacterium]|nr:PD-(D/E)XK nuclease family protein [Bacteroidota bacterium]